MHKQLNQGQGDSVGPLVLVWNEAKEQYVAEESAAGSSVGTNDNMDIKSIDSESPILQSSNEDSNGEFEKMGGERTANISSDEHHSSIEMLDVSFSADSKEDEEEEEEDVDDDTVKLSNITTDNPSKP